MDSDSSSDNSDYEQPTDDVTEEEKNRIKDEISTMSFEELQKLKEEIGSKMYAKTVYGTTDEKPNQRSFKRINKNRPREMSSKVRPKLRKKAQTIIPKTKNNKQFRDPRFDTKCGEFDKDQFRSNYKFIEDLKKDEKKQLNAEMNETKDPIRMKQIKLLIQRIDNQLRESSKLEGKEQKHKEEMTTYKQQKEHGEKPIYKKKSEKKIEELVEKYEELKKTNKLQKHIERRTKKLVNKERKKLSMVKM